MRGEGGVGKREEKGRKKERERGHVIEMRCGMRARSEKGCMRETVSDCGFAGNVCSQPNNKYAER